MVVRPEEVLCVTTENVPGYRVTRVLGEVFGITSRSRHMFSTMGAGLKSMVGGELGAFTKLIEETRAEAMGRMRLNAANMGANAVVMMRFDTETVANTAGGTVAYGTAVILEPIAPS
ncbi:MAG: heavy metal-binding domain-containing protein [Coriobacteriia bacterium]|nr:heavy metal-binding domain-containing protein [Coriobacteriia bacterium]